MEINIRLTTKRNKKNQCCPNGPPCSMPPAHTSSTTRKHSMACASTAPASTKYPLILILVHIIITPFLSTIQMPSPKQIQMTYTIQKIITPLYLQMMSKHIVWNIVFVNLILWIWRMRQLMNDIFLMSKYFVIFVKNLKIKI